MPSLQSKFMSAMIRIVVRRRDWGNEQQLVRRARRIFGTPRPFQWMWTRGVDIKRANLHYLSGEWVTPRKSNAGVILYLHGGGYVACSPATHRPVTSNLARMTRCRVFALDYRLGTEHRFPAAFDDAL